ncbi:hypothetical protein BGZ60DRAFT_406842 [Tricladium varicosporioides]|nr:hypothetical protein BGZ60DRAFT_406842 [Hymenoscyphus varicosporioides]
MLRILLISQVLNHALTTARSNKRTSSSYLVPLTSLHHRHVTQPSPTLTPKPQASSEHFRVTFDAILRPRTLPRFRPPPLSSLNSIAYAMYKPLPSLTPSRFLASYSYFPPYAIFIKPTSHPTSSQTLNDTGSTKLYR